MRSGENGFIINIEVLTPKRQLNNNFNEIVVDYGYSYELYNCEYENGLLSHSLYLSNLSNSYDNINNIFDKMKLKNKNLSNKIKKGNYIKKELDNYDIERTVEFSNTLYELIKKMKEDTGFDFGWIPE